MNNISKISVFIISAVLFAGCVIKKEVKTIPPVSYNEVSDEEVLSQAANLRPGGDYLLQPGDLVEIKVFMEDNMDREQRISGKGTITFPFIGNIKIAGHSVSSAEELISQALRKYIIRPQVSMLIKEYGNKTVYVLGQVSKPSSIEIPPEHNLTVLEAISSAGGFTDVAAQAKVRILRDDKGKREVIDVDVTQITKLGDKSLDIPLKPGDVIYVPQSMF